MHQSVTVSIAQRASHIGGYSKRLVDAELDLLAHPVAETPALDAGHDVEKQTVYVPRIEERNDVRVDKGFRDPNLPEETLRAHRGGELAMQHLDGDAACLTEIVRKVDGSGRPPSQLAPDAIAIPQGCRQGEGGIRHRSSRLGG
jgi:hypothetical protein